VFYLLAANADTTSMLVSFMTLFVMLALHYFEDGRVNAPSAALLWYWLLKIVTFGSKVINLVLNESYLDSNVPFVLNVLLFSNAVLIFVGISFLTHPLRLPSNCQLNG
jgi:hypothetical protein